jgi:hypothetical protein
MANDPLATVQSLMYETFVKEKDVLLQNTKDVLEFARLYTEGKEEEIKALRIKKFGDAYHIKNRILVIVSDQNNV